MLALLHLLLLEVHKENSCTMCYVLGTHFASNTLYAIALILTPLISFLVTLEKASDLGWLWVPWYNRYHAADPFPVMIWPHVNLVCFHGSATQALAAGRLLPAHSINTAVTVYFPRAQL